MTENANVRVDRRDGLAVIYTGGNIDNQAGEEIRKAAYGLLEGGYRVLLLNLPGTKVVDSGGISILVEIIEKMVEIDTKSGFCSLNPTLQKTFQIMGLGQYAGLYTDEATALAQIRS
jgi:anti-anti-sigma factor